MCELMAIAAALVFSLLALSARRAGRPASALATTALAFWGAALMWAVDCAHAALEGEPLLDLSWDDAALGAVVVAGLPPRDRHALEVDPAVRFGNHGGFRTVRVAGPFERGRA